MTVRDAPREESLPRRVPFILRKGQGENRLNFVEKISMQTGRE